MKYIAHRGLVEGPDKNLENNPDRIILSLKQGFDCEIDLWIQDDTFYLGHDDPQYVISKDFLNVSGLWIHAKNKEALHFLNSTNLNYFWHQEDWYTLTSHNYIWAYPGHDPTPRGVQVMPEMIDVELKNINYFAYAVCSDWILKIQAQRPKSLL